MMEQFLADRAKQEVERKLEGLVKVIWCKDCIQYERYTASDYGICYKTQQVNAPDGYCSKGSVKEADK